MWKFVIDYLRKRKGNASNENIKPDRESSISRKVKEIYGSFMIKGPFTQVKNFHFMQEFLIIVIIVQKNSVLEKNIFKLKFITKKFVHDKV